LGDRLKERVFFEIFPHFARGFILYARQAGQFPENLGNLSDKERNDLLTPFFKGTLTFLYRLLFLLYAESRDLLPVREARGYYGKSIEKLKREVEEKAGTIIDQAPEKIQRAYSESSTILYNRLQELFQGVDAGNPDINVPTYNGGFFITQADADDISPEATVARFLAKYKIPDRQLALGLDRMARDLDEKTLDLVFIDFKSLGVRQLGSIYEGLLEFKLRVALTDMAVVKGKKTEEVVPYTEAVEKKLPLVKIGRGRDARERILARDEVYLENDRRERKATGSYYTPDYIVKYIIEQTVGPILQEKLEALRPLFREAEKTLRSKKEKAAALKRQNGRADDPENETYLHHQKELNDVFFDLKVLDPAMGSGHFLVEVVDYITDRMADFLSSFRWNPIVYELALTRLEIQGEMDRQGVSIDMSKLTDLNLLKRRVLKSCIYGVDLNPMAVQLAKVSLWLDCFTLGAPLSFLDHHMKCGNSLIGGNVQEVQNALGSGLWGNQFTYLLDATQLMRKVGELSDATAREIAASKSAYKGAYDALAPFKRLLDVWISEYFDNKGAKRITQDCAGTIYDNTYSSTLAQKETEIVEKALELTKERGFFHWELEFPEVFFDETKRKENGGFDVVVGNPPYVRQEQNVFKDYFEVNYETYSGRADLYVYFLELEAKLSRSDGLVGVIVSNKFTEVDYGQAVRKFLMEVAPPQLVLDFADLPVFEDVTAYPMVLILKKNVLQKSQLIGFGQPQSLENFPNGVSIEWILAKNFTWKSPDTIFEKMNINAVSLKVYCGNPLVGIKTGANDAFIYSDHKDEHTHSDFLQPYLFGKNIGRYEIVEPIPQIVYPYKRVDKKYVPVNLADLDELGEYFKKNELILKGRAVIKDKFPRGLCKWYEYQQINHAIDYNIPKIVFPNISDKPSFAIDDRCLVDMTAFVIPANDLYLLSLLNSQLIFYIISSLAVNRRGGYLEWKVQYVEHIPIRRINFTTSSEERASYFEKARNLHAYYLDENDQQCVLDFVDHRLSQQPEESDVVHDLLAFFAEEMIRLNNEKRTIQREFLDWLVSTLKILPDKEGRVGIDALTGKAKLFDYPGDYQKDEPALSTEELLELLRKNKNRLGVSLNNAGLVDTIEKMYEENLQRVLPLKETLRKTDILIDMVVYRLYGLTEEEIRVVEGKT